MMGKRRRQPSPEGLARFSARPFQWTDMAAIGFLATQPIGHEAAEEGWISTLADYVREHHRDLPDGRVVPSLKRKAVEIEQRCEWILGDADANPIDRTMAQAVMARRSWMTNFIKARPLPQEGDAA